MRRLPVIVLVLILPFLAGCPKKRQPPVPTRPPVATPTPTPEPEPSPQPTVEPTPEATPTPTATPTPPARPTPTPAPTPSIDPAAFIPAARAGETVRLQGEEGEDYSAKIQAVMDNSTDVAQVILGSGSLKRSVILRTHTRIETTPTSPLACDQEEALPQFKMFPLSDYGCFLLADGVHVSGNFKPPQQMLDYFAKGNPRIGYDDPYFKALTALTDDEIHGNASTVLEPAFSLGPANPGIFVFQALADVGDSHMGQAQNIAVTGIVIKGRQNVYDGGVRAAMTLGNCRTCSLQSNFLRDTGSLGLQAGGSALERGNHADGFLFRHNISSGVGAANIAVVNARNTFVTNNYSRRPGRKGFGGGCSAVDLETNSSADFSGNVWVYNNLADYEGAKDPGGTGSAFLAQDPYTGPNRGKVHIVNNVAIGGRDDRLYRYMTSGYYLVGLKQCEVVNNYVFRTGQAAIQIYNIDGCLLQDNLFDSTGGGGSAGVGVWSEGMRNTIVRRNDYIARPIAISMSAGFLEVCGENNQYIDNLVQGHTKPVDATRECDRTPEVKGPPE